MKTNKKFSLLVSLAVALGSLAVGGLAQTPVDTWSDTWAAVDALGRPLPLEDTAPAAREGKFVGVFYYLWHGAHNGPDQPGQGVIPIEDADPKSPYDNSIILQDPPGQRNWGPYWAFHHWGESLYGYYVADDEWVIRRNAQLLSDAGVDVIIFDVTNAISYRDIYMNLLRIYSEIRKEGGKTPAVSFLTNTRHDLVVEAVYRDLYSKGLYQDLWFYWKGKPLVMANPEGLRPELQEFFTLRRSWAWTRDGGAGNWFKDGKDAWPWLDHTPQGYGWHEAPDIPEQIVVCTAEHPNSDRGKSFHNGSNPKPHQTEKGLYFAEQWEHALEVDPEFIFVTQWNEWLAMRFTNEDYKWSEYAGEPVQDPEGIFVDVYNMEYNRDMEPMKGGYGFNYYYQMWSNIRKFKGVRPLPEASPAMPASWSLADWSRVQPTYRDDRGDTFHRNHRGYGPRLGMYVNKTGRNDITECKVALAGKRLYFMAECAEALSQPIDSQWMNLWFTIEGNRQPEWNGIQYRVQFDEKGKKAILYQYNPETVSNWRPLKTLFCKVEEKRVIIGLPKEFIQAPADEKLRLRFKWSDNMQDENDPMDWLLHGDTAPNGRALYRWVSPYGWRNR
jgi:hypothetical protein